MFSWEFAIPAIIFEFHIMWMVWSIFVHRGLCHRNFIFSPALAHFFRFYLWFSKRGTWPNWMQHYAAIHRKHHVFSDTKNDLHSPFNFTLHQMIHDAGSYPNGANYISADEIIKYAPDIVSTNDWVERNIYCKYPGLGTFIFLIVFTVLFGPIGFIYGLAKHLYSKHIFYFCGYWLIHKVGFTYAGNKGSDRSKTLFPIGFFLAGEELHANHHNSPLPYNHRRWFEVDTGWWWCRLFLALRLMKRT